MYVFMYVGVHVCRYIYAYIHRDRLVRMNIYTYAYTDCLQVSPQAHGSHWNVQLCRRAIDTKKRLD